jgi:hypothetical protein
MSAWRRAGIERLPGFRSLIEQATSPMALWIDLWLAFEDAFEEGNQERIRKILEYARLCWSSQSDDVVTAVMCGFFEHLPQRADIRKAIPTLISSAEFGQLKEVFRYHGGDSAIDELDRAFKDPQRFKIQSRAK